MKRERRKRDVCCEAVVTGCMRGQFLSLQNNRSMTFLCLYDLLSSGYGVFRASDDGMTAFVRAFPSRSRRPSARICAKRRRRPRAFQTVRNYLVTGGQKLPSSETTMALDTKTERAIQQPLAELSAGRTTLVIATASYHRQCRQHSRPRRPMHRLAIKPCPAHRPEERMIQEPPGVTG
ncbi:hypothetical protein HOE425_150019 [Hoeflea sp. EC-HK425]|nr:hypothetical protein HOE425_150019 [Hoeflea sp. EC-HK425]